VPIIQRGFVKKLGTRCRVFRSVDQTIGNAAFTAVTWDSESYDVGAMHSTVTDTSRVTIPTGEGGYYLIIARATWLTHATGSRRDTVIYVDGAPASNAYGTNADDSGYRSTTCTDILSLAAGKYIEMYVRQSSDGDLSIVGAENHSFLSVIKIG
jgi:hypothetical protein